MTTTPGGWWSSCSPSRLHAVILSGLELIQSCARCHKQPLYLSIYVTDFALRCFTKKYQFYTYEHFTAYKAIFKHTSAQAHLEESLNEVVSATNPHYLDN